MPEHISINASTVDQVVAEALAAIGAADDIAALRAGRNSTVGEQSPIAKLNAALKNLPHEEKKNVTQILFDFVVVGNERN
jgi:phenylalanyl-tRNA synthetase alpha chain